MQDDDKLHLLAGFIVGVWLEPHIGFLPAWTLAVAVGASKEVIWDLLLGKGDPDRGDAAWTAYGGFLGAFVAWVVGGG
jgi:hypothetical protein